MIPLSPKHSLAVAVTLLLLLIGIAGLLLFAGSRPRTAEPLTAGGIANPPTTPAPPTPAAPARTVSNPIYLTVLTHIEEPSPQKKPDYTTNEPLFRRQRATYVRLANFLHERNIPFAFQSDWNYLLATKMFDTGDEATNGKNMVRWMAEDLGFSIDPHAHETDYNYADVAALIAELGVTPTNVVGGFLIYPAEVSKLEYLREPIHGNHYDYTWQAEILWGGGTQYHIDDDHVNTSGVWRPKSTQEFFVDDPESPLPNVGSFGGGWPMVQLLLNLQKAGKLKENAIYTVHVMCSPESILEDSFFAQLEERLDAIEDDVAAGRVIFADLPTIVEDWKTIYRSQPNHLTVPEARALIGSRE